LETAWPRPNPIGDARLLARQFHPLDVHGVARRSWADSLCRAARAIRQQIASAIQIIIQVSRLADGSRRVTSVQEITGMEGDTLTMQEIFRFEQTGMDKRGRVLGVFGPTGIRPRWSERIASFGIDLGNDLFGGEERRGAP
jgi:hypothetical protein